MSSDPAGFKLINPMEEPGKPRSGFKVIEANNPYSYVANSPTRYIDPTGLAIESVDKESNAFLLEQINKVGGEGFYFDDNNQLQLDPDADPGSGYSQTARDMLIAGINDTKKTAYLKAAWAFDEEFGQEVGFAGFINGSSNSGVAVIRGPKMFGDDLTSFLGSKFNMTPENGQPLALVHELLGHVLPSLGITKVKDALALERKIRSELNIDTNTGPDRITDPAILGNDALYEFDYIKDLK